MIITAVERTKRRRGRVDVYVDGTLAFDLKRDTARSRDLRPGRTVEQSELDAIIAEDRRRTALDAAVAMLARRPRSEREVRRRLAQQKCDVGVADQTIARLKGARLLDDGEYARSFTEARDHSSPRGRRLLVQELRANGIDVAIAQEAASQVSEDDAAYRAASRSLRSFPQLDYPSFRDRLGARLQRRGFGWQTCRLTIDRCWRELQGDPVAAVDGDTGQGG